MERFKTIPHRGRTIIYSDLTNFNAHTQEDLQGAINEVKAEIAKHPHDSVLILTDVTGLRFDTEIIRKFVDYTKQNKPYIKASAVVGVKGMMQFVFYCLSKKTLRDIRSFDSKNDALDWLAEQ